MNLIFALRLQKAKGWLYLPEGAVLAVWAPANVRQEYPFWLAVTTEATALPPSHRLALATTEFRKRKKRHDDDHGVVLNDIAAAEEKKESNRSHARSEDGPRVRVAAMEVDAAEQALIPPGKRESRQWSVLDDDHDNDDEGDVAAEEKKNAESDMAQMDEEEKEQDESKDDEQEESAPEDENENEDEDESDDDSEVAVQWLDRMVSKKDRAEWSRKVFVSKPLQRNVNNAEFREILEWSWIEMETDSEDGDSVELGAILAWEYHGSALQRQGRSSRYRLHASFLDRIEDSLVECGYQTGKE